jgi:hypothetical protein
MRLHWLRDRVAQLQFLVSCPPHPWPRQHSRLLHQGAPTSSAQGSGSLHRAGSVHCQLSASFRF